jgi:rhamnosyltransferase
VKPSGVRIAAVVALYHPVADVLENIRTWSDQVEVTYAVDNSEPPARDFAEQLASFRNVIYLPQTENQGIARALNIGAELAIKEGYNFLLTMDQDSMAAPDMVSCMIGCLEGVDRTRVAIISPFHVTKAEPKPKSHLFSQVILTAMTSGNLLNLEVYQVVGPFREDLFIDFVDHEFCLRLRENNYMVIQVNKALLLHNVGDIRVYSFFGLRLIATNHSALRRYYKTRNRFYVVRKYKKVSQRFYYENIVRFIKELLVIALFEKNKVDQYRMILKGFLDYRRSRFGKYDPQSLQRG